MAKPSCQKAVFGRPTRKAGGSSAIASNPSAGRDYPQDKSECVLVDADQGQYRELANTLAPGWRGDHGRNSKTVKRSALVHATGDLVGFVSGQRNRASRFHPRAIDAYPKIPALMAGGVTILYSPQNSFAPSHCLLAHHRPGAWRNEHQPLCFEGRMETSEHWTFREGSGRSLGSTGFRVSQSGIGYGACGRRHSTRHSINQSSDRSGSVAIFRGRGVFHYDVPRAAFLAGAADF